MAVALALFGALAYGLSDFLGGVLARRTSVWPVALLSCVGALLATLVLAFVDPGNPSTADLGWGLAAGVGSGAGTAFLYRGLATGRMGVVAPISAVGSALIPLAIGVATGERPSLLAWVGLLTAIPGIWLVSREPETPSNSEPAAASGRDSATANGVLDGVAAGIGFGLLFASAGQIGEGAGFWPVVGTQAVSIAMVITVCLVLGGDPLPRHRAELWALAPGVCATLAVVGFVLASQRGLLSLSAVLTSLYPAATVLLASVLLKEHIDRTQAIGLTLCAVTVSMVALG